MTKKWYQVVPKWCFPRRALYMGSVYINPLGIGYRKKFIRLRTWA